MSRGTPVVNFLDQSRIIPGLLQGGGLNRSGSRLGIPPNTYWTIDNLVPAAEGLSNVSIGVSAISSPDAATSPVKAIIPFREYLLVIKGGSLYKASKTYGALQLLAAGAFATSGEVDYAYASDGTSTDGVVFIVDGVNAPKRWNGTTLITETVFNSAILGVTFPYPDKVTTYIDRLIYGFPSATDFKNHVLFSDSNNGRQFTSGNSQFFGFFDVIEPGDGGYVTAIGTLAVQNTPENSQRPVVFKGSKAYVGGPVQAPATGQTFITFNLQATNIGAVNNKCLINFENDLLGLSNFSIGQLTAAIQSGGVESIGYQFALRVQSLIQQGAQNAAFSKAWAVHCPEKRLIMWSMPATANASSTAYDIAYPEVPQGLTICYNYGVQDLQGNVSNYWSTRSGAGWGFSCAATIDGEVYLGTYFGEVYKLFSGDEYYRNPATPTVKQVIMSTLETGDQVLDKKLNTSKGIIRVRSHFKSFNAIETMTSIYYDEKETGNTYAKVSKEPLVAGAVYGTAVYGAAVYAVTTQVQSSVTPTNMGRTARMKLSWPSFTATILNNTAILTGIDGELEQGGVQLRN